MVVHKAQDLAARPRTEDIRISEEIDFKSMLLPKPLLKGLTRSGYVRPSPIQRKSLPLVRCGMDLVVQAKAGTGKTCIFALAALELVQPKLQHLQAVVLAPTREIALQIKEVVESLGQAIEGLKARCFIGGYPLALDKENAAGCHIAIGAPGRMRHLMEDGILKPKYARLFVLDEADKLMEKIFLVDINKIYSFLPESKQVLAFSATYTEEMVKFLCNYMNQGQYVSPESNTNTTLLIGIRQFVSVLPHHVDKLATLRLKDRHLLYLLCSIPFNQCLVFSNIQSRAVSLCNMLRKEGWSVDWIAGHQQQVDRVIALSQLKEQRVRVLVTTDLTARGIDAEHVNLIINLDLPRDYQTYLHRMGRAGRFGSHGLVVTVLSAGNELVAFQKLLGKIGGTSQAVNCVPEDLKNVDLWSASDGSFKQVFGVVQTGEPVSSEPLVDPQTSADEQYSPESSDSAEGNVCDKENLFNTNICKCNLYEAGPSDIELVSGPSLFTVSEKEKHWQEVLPVVINESQIPLNTPITLLDSKFIRIKNIPDRSEVENIKEINNPIEPSSFLATTDETNFLTFDEINSILEKGSYVQINLENNVTKSEDKDKIQVCTKLKDTEKVLSKYQNDKATLENTLIGYDSFDVVGWMAVDRVHNIVENIKKHKLSVFKFDVVECPFGKRHIKVVSSFDHSNISQGNFDDNITTLSVNSLNLVPPYTLESISEKLKPACNTQNSIKHLTENKSHVNFNEMKPIYNIPYPSDIIFENGYEKKRKESFKNGKQNSDEIVTTNNQSNHRMNTKSSFMNNVKDNNCKKAVNNFDVQKQNVKEPVNNSAVQKEIRNIVSNGDSRLKDQTNKMLNQVQRIAHKSRSSVDEIEVYSHKENVENHLIKTTNFATQNTTTHKVNHKCYRKEVSSELSNESDTSSPEKYSKASSLSDEESGSCRGTNCWDRWQQLHDREESDSESSSKPGALRSQKTSHLTDHFSDSTSSNCHSVHSTNQKLPRRMRNTCKHNSNDSCEDYESVISNHNSFETACSQHLTCGQVNNEDVFIPPYCHHDKSSDSVDDLRHEKEFLYCSSRPCNSTHDRRSCAPVSKAFTSNGFQNYNSYRNPEFHVHGQNRPEKKSSNKNTFTTYVPHQNTKGKPQHVSKRLTSKNLLSEWYLTWYKQVRQRASQLEFAEYVNVMSTH